MTTATAKLTTFRRSLALVGALAAMSVTAISFAAPADDVASIAVRYDDLNLATAAGVNTLYSRISSAARQVCPDPFSRDLTVVIASERCQAGAIARAVHEVNNPQLAMVYASHTSHG
jgi:UrcA family protein